MGKLILFILLTVFSAFWSRQPFAQEAKPVALQIYFHDAFAMDQKSEDLFERIFASLRPELTYRRISIDAGQSAELIKEQLSKHTAEALQPGEALAYLILDTHGGSEKLPAGGQQTSLRHLGKISETEVDADFDRIFSPLKTRSQEDLQIILNSCSTFCGGEQSALRRGQAMLDYFGAENGGIYGAVVPEVSQAFDYTEFVKWKYLLPDFKMVSTIAAVTAALTLPLMGFDYYQSSGLTEALLMAPAASAGIGSGAGLAATLLKPVFQFLASRTFANRGYYFAFKNGEPAEAFRIVKYKDLKNIILRRLSPANCEALLK